MVTVYKGHLQIMYIQCFRSDKSITIIFFARSEVPTLVFDKICLSNHGLNVSSVNV